jgi:uncharacterized protein YcbK (DUF882 family)
MINDIRISPHFKLREFECRCCGAVKLSRGLLGMLEALRIEYGMPLVITSGYRCPGHNRRVMGASKSLHLLGRAADVRAGEADQAVLKGLAEEIGFQEVICGDEKHYIHLAIR